MEVYLTMENKFKNIILITFITKVTCGLHRIALHAVMVRSWTNLKRAEYDAA